MIPCDRQLIELTEAINRGLCFFDSLISPERDRHDAGSENLTPVRTRNNRGEFIFRERITYMSTIHAN